MNPLLNQSLFTFGPFTPQNWLCPCCKQAVITPELLRCVWHVWHNAGSTFRITSAYRCPAHNAAVGGAPHSYHTFGQAVDLKPIAMSPAELAIIAYTSVEWSRHGVLLEPEKGIIHLDLRPTPAALVQTKNGWAPLWPWIRQRYPHLPCPEHQAQTATRLAAPSEPSPLSSPDSPVAPPPPLPQHPGYPNDTHS